MHELGYSFNGDAPIAGLLPVEADALVLGKLLHDNPRPKARSQATAGRKQEMRQNHARETERMLAEIESTA